ncbi:MAG: SNF2-related protein, partial [Actinomycetota bacterium]|nr:SNF2-related protein [Actinomycetota bacterium]
MPRPQISVCEWLSDLVALLNRSDVETTFVDAEPPRDGWLACWSPTDSLAEADTDLTLIRPNGDRPAAVPTRVKRVKISQAITALTQVDSGSRSTAVYAEACRTALGWVAEARIQPGLTPRGVDCWKPGPLTPDDHGRQRRLVDALPAAGHALPHVGRRLHEAPTGQEPPLEMMSASRALDGFFTAVIDAFVRTAAAPIAAGHQAFASHGSIVVDSKATLGGLSRLAVEADQGRIPLVTLRIGTEHFDGNKPGFRAVLGLQSRNDAALTANVEDLVQAPDDLRARLAPVENEIAMVLKRASRIWPALAVFIESPAEQPPSMIELALNELEALLGPLGLRLGATGLSVIAPPGLFASLDLSPVVSSRLDADARTRRTSRPRPLDRPELSDTWRDSDEGVIVGWNRGLGRGLDLSSLLELRWQGSLGGQQLTEAELAEIIDSKRSVVRLRDQWIRVDPESLERLREKRSLPASAAIAAALGLPVTVGGDVQRIEVSGRLAELSNRLRQLESVQQLAPPATLHATLRPYQERGLAWLVEMDELGLGGILADDMGLGKTIQVIALHLQRQARQPSPTLVICPASVVGNWQRELERFAPDVAVTRYHGARRVLPSPEPGSVILTTYGIARRDAASLSKLGWGLVVADEAQAIKNPTSRTSRAMRTLPSSTRFALTGTPVQNQLLDLWSILEWTTPGLLGPQERFRQEIVVPIEQHGDPESADRLNRMLRPFLLRRKKSDPEIVPDLPPKTETDEIVPMTIEQVALYQAVVAEIMAEIGGASGINRHGLVLMLKPRQKQVCNHPAHL